MVVPKSPFHRRRWVRRAAIGAVVSVALFALIGFVALPPILRRVAEGQIGAQLGRRASIGRVRVNPFALSLAIDDFRIYERDGTTPFLGFAHFYVNVQLSSVVRRAPVVQEIRLEGLQMHVVRERQTPDGFADLATYNFADILAKLQAAAAREPPAPAPAYPEPPRFSVNNIHLVDWGVTFDDRPTGGHHEVAHLSVGVPFVSTLPVDVDTFVKPGLAVTIDGTPFSIEGKTKPFKDSLETTLELRLNALDLARYQPYVPIPLKFRLEEARLTVALDLSFSRPGDGKPAVTLKGHVGLDHLRVRDADATAAPLVDLASAGVDVGRADLSAMRFQVDKVTLSGLEVHARRLRDGTIDLPRLLTPSRAAADDPKGGRARSPTPARTAPAASASTTALRFEVDDIALDKINVHLRDETVRPPFVESIRDVSVQVRHLSNAPGARATMTVRAIAVPGGTLAQTGTLSLDPLAATGKVTLEGIEPARFAPYYRDLIAFDLAEGRVRLGAEYRVATKGRHASVGLDDAFVELSNLRLRRRSATGKAAPDDFFRMGSLAVRNVKLDVDERLVQVGAISSGDARVRVARSETGVIDLTTLRAPSAKTSSVTTNDGSRPVTEEPPGRPSVPPSVAAAEPRPWTVNVAAVDIEGWAARFDDQGVKPRASLTVDGLAIHARGLSTKPGSRAAFEVKLALNKSGKLQLGGSVVADPLAANVRLDLREIQILPFQPYFRDKVNMVVSDGAVSVKGQVKVEPTSAALASRPTGAASAAPPRITFTGDFDLANFGALDGYKNEKLLAWKSFHVGGVSFVSAPAAVSIRDLALTDFSARLMIFPDAHFNLQDIAVKEQPSGSAVGASSPSQPVLAGQGKESGVPGVASSPPTHQPPPPPQVRIAQVTLQGGEVMFTDRLIKPNYSAQLTELGGRITGLSTDAQTTAEVALRGAVDHSGALAIEGRMNPLAKDLFVDLKINLTDFELPPTSPYSGRYAGYGIEKGKLSLSLDYHIAGRKLDARNKLTLDQFTFGDKVASPDALKLPVRLAVALLKDRHGVIDIDLPITGSLDDPQFKLGHLILKTLGNLVVKAVTAPFSLIASAFGGGDEESYLEFPSGVARLTPKGLTKLKGIGKALQERPGLSFEIEGLADPQADKGGLRQELYDRKLRAQKQRLLAESGQAAASAETVPLDGADRPQLIEAVYHKDTFPKPRAANGAEKVLPPGEMEKLILANIRVEGDDLRQLALRRANAVKDVLGKSAPDAAPRLFLVSPRTAIPGNRVELKLKRD